MVAAEDEARFRALMQTHHYLGAVPGMGETVRYVAHHRGRWLALLVFSAPALKCGARDRWVGWDRGVQFARLHLVTNNSRFLILPGGERNLGSRVLSLCTRRLVRDWPARFGHDVLLAETFVDPALFRGTLYRAANWIEAGRTRGFARGGAGYNEHARPKLVFLHPLCRGARARLGAADLDPRLRKGVPKMTLSAAQMRFLPECCFSHFLVEPPWELAGLFRRRIAWDDGAIREPVGAVAFSMSRCCRSGEDVDARAPSVDKAWASAQHLSRPCPHAP